MRRCGTPAQNSSYKGNETDSSTSFIKQRAGAVQHDGYRMEGAGRTVVIAAVIVVVNIFIHDQCSDINVI